MSRQGRGFTLIEMLIALAVFAVLGVLSQQLVSRILQVHKVTTERGERLSELDRAMQILGRDIMQMNSRGIRDELGGYLPALQLGTNALIEFSHSGWSNELGQARSSLQRVAYVINDETLYRHYYTVLDRSPDSKPLTQVLLTGVRGIEFKVLDSTGQEHRFWPDQSQTNSYLTAVSMRIDVQPFGEINRLWLVPSPVTTGLGP